MSPVKDSQTVLDVFQLPGIVKPQIIYMCFLQSLTFISVHAMFFLVLMFVYLSGICFYLGGKLQKADTGPLTEKSREGSTFIEDLSEFRVLHTCNLHFC